MVLFLVTRIALAGPSGEGAVGGAAPATVHLTADRPPQVVIQAAEGLTVVVPACRGISWERFDTASGRFQAVAGAPCASGSGTRSVGPAGVTLTVPDPAPVGVVRATVVVGVGCAPDLPLEVAGCSRIEGLSTEQISLGH